jgi:hypothetical protein
MGFMRKEELLRDYVLQDVGLVGETRGKEQLGICCSLPNLQNLFVGN